MSSVTLLSGGGLYGTAIGVSPTTDISGFTSEQIRALSY